MKRWLLIDTGTTGSRGWPCQNINQKSHLKKKKERKKMSKLEDCFFGFVPGFSFLVLRPSWQMSVVSFQLFRVKRKRKFLDWMAFLWCNPEAFAGPALQPFPPARPFADIINKKKHKKTTVPIFGGRYYLPQLNLEQTPTSGDGWNDSWRIASLAISFCDSVRQQ